MPKRDAAAAVGGAKKATMAVTKKAKKAEPVPEPVPEPVIDDDDDSEEVEEEGNDEEDEEEEGEEEEGEEEEGEEEEEEAAAEEEEAEEGASDFKDYNIDCRDCSTSFVFTSGEQAWPRSKLAACWALDPLPGPVALAGVLRRERLRQPEDTLQGVHRRQEGALQRGQG